jgi:hypothetical protein
MSFSFVVRFAFAGFYFVTVLQFDIYLADVSILPRGLCGKSQNTA